uniref:Uncharacterized protein n=1 Tax=Arundo donax TaxID=35708 RepID=A0A0A9BI00_ARUDO
MCWLMKIGGIFTIIICLLHAGALI